MKNDGNTSASFEVSFSLYDNLNGSRVAQVSQTGNADVNVSVIVRANMMVTGLELWSVPRPYLYTLVVEVKAADGTVLDTFNDSSVGFRTIRFDADTGFHLNGQDVKVRGFCDHNDFASVGVAVPDRLNLFRAQAMRSVGGQGSRK